MGHYKLFHAQIYHPAGARLGAERGAFRFTSAEKEALTVKVQSFFLPVN
jgi:hypothetical protein